MSRSDPDQQRAANPDTPAQLLLDLLLDFPGEVLRNPSFKLAVVADPSLLASASLARRAMIALDAEYRSIGLNGAGEEVLALVAFCDRRNKSRFRFRPSSTLLAFECSPSDFPSAKAARSALRGASALASAILGRAEGTQISSFFRQESAKSGGEAYGETEIRPKRGPSLSLAQSADRVFRDLFDFHACFRLDIKGGGQDLNAELLDSAWQASLEMVRTPASGTTLSSCFEIDGGDTGVKSIRPADPAAFEDSVRALEALVPRSSQDKVVIVIDDTHGFVLDVGVHIFTRDAKELLGSDGVRGLRLALRYHLADACEDLGIDASDADNDDSDELDEESDEHGESDETGEAPRYRVSTALDQVHHLADPVFITERYADEFDFRIAAFRAGKLIAFRADGLEMQPVMARASLRRSK